jgi:hypothetical protein
VPPQDQHDAPAIDHVQEQPLPSGDRGNGVEESEEELLNALAETHIFINQERDAAIREQRQKLEQVIAICERYKAIPTTFHIFINLFIVITHDIEKVIAELLPMESVEDYESGMWDYIVEIYQGFRFKSRAYRERDTLHKMTERTQQIKRLSLNKTLGLKSEPEKRDLENDYIRFQDIYEDFIEEISRLLTDNAVKHNKDFLLLPTGSHMDILHALHKLADIMSQAVY